MKLVDDFALFLSFSTHMETSPYLSFSKWQIYFNLDVLGAQDHALNNEGSL